MSHRYEGPRSRPKREIDQHLLQFLVKIVRDAAIFILGAYAFIHELSRTGSERPQILIMSAAMMGLPLIIRGDEKRQEGKSSNVDKQDSA